jgi:hypothetical protein
MRSCRARRYLDEENPQASIRRRVKAARAELGSAQSECKMSVRSTLQTGGHA